MQTFKTNSKRQKILARFLCPTAVLAWTISFILAGCSNSAAEKMPAKNSSADSASKDTLSTDTTSVPKEEQAKIYSQAIAEYIKAVYQKDKTVFDTLFFGKHVDFPEIELPVNIQNTNIRLLQPDEGLKKQRERKSLVYVNLFGWITKEKAEFIFVTFFDSCRHQYDYFIDFKYDTKRKEFALEKIGFESYVNIAAGKPKRIAIYEDGKYVVDAEKKDGGK